jgi:hypothetical protein
MSNKSGNSTEIPVCRAQIWIELESARQTVDRLASVIRIVGDAGATDPNTSHELETTLGAAYAAAYRWLLESRLMAAGVGIASA